MGSHIIDLVKELVERTAVRAAKPQLWEEHTFFQTCT